MPEVINELVNESNYLNYNQAKIDRHLSADIDKSLREYTQGVTLSESDGV